MSKKEEPSLEVQLVRAKSGNAIRDSRIDALESAQRFDQKLIEACHHAMTVLGDKSKAYAELIASLQDENKRLKEGNEYLGQMHDKEMERSAYLLEEFNRTKAEVERLESDLNLEKENEDRLVRDWQRANNEVHGQATQIAALIDNQTRLKAENERLRKELADAQENYHLVNETVAKLIKEGKQS